MEFFIHGWGSGVSNIARDLSCGINITTRLLSRNLEGFLEISSFSCFFHHVHQYSYANFLAKKSENVYITEATVFVRVPRAKETVEMERGDQFLNFACSDISQLQIAKKLQLFKVAQFG